LKGRLKEHLPLFYTKAVSFYSRVPTQEKLNKERKITLEKNLARFLAAMFHPEVNRSGMERGIWTF
jgi:hypothetical protein